MEEVVVDAVSLVGRSRRVVTFLRLLLTAQQLFPHKLQQFLENNRVVV
jgi:hypothetical protein